MDFWFVTTIKVQFRDVDSMGHVNNAVYVSYLETARMEFYERVFGHDGFRRFPYILAEVQVRYLRPARLKDLLDLGIRVSQVGRKSFKFEYVIRNHATGEVVCEAETTQVMYDYEAEVSREVPDEWRRRIESLGVTPDESEPRAGVGTSTGGSR